MKNKKSVLLFLLISLFFASILFGASGFSDTVFAADTATGAQSGSSAAAAAAIQSGSAIQDTDGQLLTAFKWLLYGLLLILVKFVQVAASVFAWATRPEYISGPTGLLNLDSVYVLWQFVRDFFNLFFIFLLLFSAFATVFQIESFNLKKNFGKIIFAAIAINFSFPLTRMVMDLGNVPMYFFADGIVSAGATNGNALMSIPSALWGSTDMGKILAIPDPEVDGTLVPLITAIIFTFIFMITLFTLALLFVLRLLKLVVLLILSPVGLAASIVPGLKKLGSQWQDQLLQTVLFGPAAMFMIVLALRFSAEIQGSDFAKGLSATAPATDQTSQSSIISQGVFFIPIIMMWMAMHMGNKFGIQGASAIMKKADQVAAWGKKQALFSKGSYTRKGAGVVASPVTNRFKGYKSGIKDRFDKTPLIGAKYRKDRAESVEALAKARAKGIFGEKGMKSELLDKAKKNLLNTRANEKLKKDKEDGIGPVEALSRFDKKNGKYTSSKEERLAALKYLTSEKDALKDATPEQLAAMTEIADIAGNKDLAQKAIKNAGSDAVKLDTATIEAMKNGFVAAHIKDPADIAERQRLEKDFLDNLKDKLEKEGRMKVFVEYETQRPQTQTQNQKTSVQAYDDNIRPLKPKEFGKLKDVATTNALGVKVLPPEYLAALQDKWNNEWSSKDRSDAYGELSPDDKKLWAFHNMRP